MSDEGHIPRRERCGADAAAYGLGALEAAEAEAFEHHLAECERCAEEVARYGRVVDALAMSAQQYPVPWRLRRRVMRSVRSEPRRSRAHPRRRAPMAFLSHAWPPRAGLGTAAAVGLAAAVVAIATLVSGGSAGVRVLKATVIDSAGSAQVRVADGRAELIVRHFPAPATGHIYEVWLKRPGRAPEPTRTLFGVSAQGAGDIGVPDTLRGVEEFFVTEEPAGGSRVPTHPAVIVGRLS